MRTSLVILLLAIVCTGFSQTPGNAPRNFLLLECTGDKLTIETRNSLKAKIEPVKSVVALEDSLKKWASHNKLYDIKAVIQELRDPGETYVWLQSPRFGNNLTKVTGVRGDGDLTTSQLLSCVFSDTLIVIDTLKLQLPVRANEQFILRVGVTEYPIPRLNSSGFLLSPMIFSGLPTGKYIDAIIVQRSDASPAVSRQLKLYMFSVNERVDFSQSLNHWFSDGNSDCSLLVGSVSNYIEKVKGHNQCNTTNIYKLALGNSIRRLVKRLAINCQ